MGKLDGKTAIVSGAGQGVGRGIALALAKEGANVVIAEINGETAEITSQEIKSFQGRSIPCVCDVRKREEVNETVQMAFDKFGWVDILVNNAQAMRNNVPFEDTTDEDIALALESGLMATFYFMQSCFPYFKKNGGKIINIGSAAGTEGHPGWAAYAAAKEGIRALTRVAAHEWGKHRINVNAICPLAQTPKMKAWSDSSPEVLSMMLMTVPMGRLGHCENDIGRVAVFLASADSDYVTGQTIMVDGGQSMLR